MKIILVLVITITQFSKLVGYKQALFEHILRHTITVDIYSSRLLEKEMTTAITSSSMLQASLRSVRTGTTLIVEEVIGLDTDHETEYFLQTPKFSLYFLHVMILTTS